MPMERCEGWRFGENFFNLFPASGFSSGGGGGCHVVESIDSLYPVLVALGAFMVAVPLARLFFGALTWLLGNFFVVQKRQAGRESPTRVLIFLSTDFVRSK